MVRQLLDKGADVASMDNISRTPISFAAKNGHTEVIIILLSTDKIKLDLKDHYMSTPLSIVVRHGYTEVVKLLLDTRRIDLNSRDCFRQTPLWYTRRYGHSDILQLLHYNAEQSGISLLKDDSPLETSSRCHDVISRWCDVCTFSVTKDDLYLLLLQSL